jgi:enoyl-CoA hydratase
VAAEFEVFRIERRDAAAIVWLNRPEKLNAMAPVFFRELPTVLAEAAAEPETGAIVLTGEGRAFSAGGDIASVPALADLAACRRHLRLVFDAFNAVERAELPVIGAVNGIAYGGGTELTLACDLVLASDRARFAFKEPTVGLMPGYGVVRGPDVIGRSWTRWLAFTGDEIDAEQALAIGLVQRVVPHEKLLDEALALAGRIAANPQSAVRVAKSFVNADTAGRALADSIESTALLFTTDDHKQAVAAFLGRTRTDGG